MDGERLRIDPNAPIGISDAAAELDRREKEHEAFMARLEAAGWPSHLIKAACDPFDYAAHVRGLGIVEFVSAREDSPGWVFLMRRRPPRSTHSTTAKTARALPYLFDRGVCVRLADIAWVADAPNGS